jgi:glyoxylase-like metal-dependent hydrolase (beta-lactamase superfamily II)
MTRTLAALIALASVCACAQTTPKPPKSPRIYVFDCGSIKAMDVTLYGFKQGEVQGRDFVVPCYLIVHPKGTLMFDTGVIPDGDLKDGGPTVQGSFTVMKSLRSQMQQIGYKASDIGLLALSHYHADHTANANDFAGALWLVRQKEYDVMFADKPTGIIRPAHYTKLKDAKKKFLTEDEYDVFGDKTVILKYTPGHTPGHQVLFVKLKKTGPVLLVGDLYHYPEERTLNRFPGFEFDKEQSAASRKAVDEFLKKTKAQMWIEHDFETYNKLKKAPAYLE